MGKGRPAPLSIVLPGAVIIHMYLSVFIIFYFFIFFFTMHENLFFFIKIKGKFKKMDFMYNRIKCGHF